MGGKKKQESWSRNKPGFDESVAGVHHVIHLQVDGGVHDCHNQALFKRQTGRVHKLQQDGEALRVHLWVQTDGIEVALVGVSKDGIEEPTVATAKTQSNHQLQDLSVGGQKKWLM